MQKKTEANSNDLSHNEAVFNAFSYQVIVGLIQLLIDEGLVDQDERNGFYVNAKDFRIKATEIYQGIDGLQKKELIKYCQLKRYLHCPFT